MMRALNKALGALSRGRPREWPSMIRWLLADLAIATLIVAGLWTLATGFVLIAGAAR